MPEDNPDFLIIQVYDLKGEFMGFYKDLQNTKKNILYLTPDKKNAPHYTQKQANDILDDLNCRGYIAKFIGIESPMSKLERVVISQNKKFN